MSTIIDRRLNQGQKNLSNRQRFIKRSREHIQKSIRENLQNRSIQDVHSGEKVKVPTDSIREPTFGHDWQSGTKKRVLPGNKDYVPSDRISRPEGQGSGSGTGNQASNDDQTFEDDFAFTLTKEEFYDLFFEDLELPDLVKKQLKQTSKWEVRREGISTVGNPSNLNVIRTMKSSLGRRLVLRKPHEKQLQDLMDQLDQLDELDPLRPQLEQQIQALTSKVRSVSYVDPIDLRYNVFNKRRVPSTSAVMICIMDVSGSMDEHKKDLAKRFFMLLYLFLQKKYENVHVEFVRHHTEASRVDEHTFFYDKLTGGTIVSSALELTKEQILPEYDSHTHNIYICQVSDGDNWEDDNPKCRQILLDDLLPAVQYMAYIEITDSKFAEEYPLLNYYNSRLFNTYQTVHHNNPKLQIAKVATANDIYKVFRNLFEKK